jgi:hypothetical protein
MSFILIAAPVYKRSWILPTWFDFIVSQDWPLSDLGFVFELGPNDPETLECLLDFHRHHPEVKCFDFGCNEKLQHQEHPKNARSWNMMKYKTMALMRNALLARANALKPDRYFSLDTDILLENPATISSLYQLTETLDAVGPILYMTPDSVHFPSVMSWIPGTERGHRRPDYPIGSLFQADVIMAAKMMRPEVYSKVYYQAHPQGEDLAWSLVMDKYGFKKYCASYIHAIHIMYPSMLEAYQKLGQDPRLVSCG